MMVGEGPLSWRGARCVGARRTGGRGGQVFARRRDRYRQMAGQVGQDGEYGPRGTRMRGKFLRNKM